MIAPPADWHKSIGIVVSGHWYSCVARCKLGGMTAKTSLLAALIVAGFAGAIGYATQSPKAAQDNLNIVVYKTPTCGCCSIWVEHMRKNGFTVDARDVSHEELSAIKAKHHVPASLQSCHTGIVNGYAIEGHIPAAEIRRFLSAKPAAAGIAVPGMPLGSPGMDGPPGAKLRPYTVLSFDREGKTDVFATIQP